MALKVSISVEVRDAKSGSFSDQHQYESTDLYCVSINDILSAIGEISVSLSKIATANFYAKIAEKNMEEDQEA